MPPAYFRYHKHGPGRPCPGQCQIHVLVSPDDFAHNPFVAVPFGPMHGNLSVESAVRKGHVRKLLVGGPLDELVGESCIDTEIGRGCGVGDSRIREFWTFKKVLCARRPFMGVIFPRQR